jgi:hypothetical protein
MRALVISVAAAGVLALGGVSSAAQISSPMIFFGGGQEKAHCVVLNGGDTPVAVTLTIINQFAGTEATESCDGPLGPGQFCAHRTAIDHPGAYACIASAGSVTKLRGALAIEEEAIDQFGGAYLRPVRSAPLR